MKVRSSKTLFGALNLRTSRFYWKQADAGNSQQFIMFLHQLHKAHPNKKLAIILDNGSIHKSKHSHYYRTGWIIFSTIDKSPNFLVKYYKKRMQIEQNFKDIKNQELGLGLRQNQSKSKERITMLWFLACLIIIISWWVGLMVEASNRHRPYQANTVKNKRVRSFIHLARMVYRHEPDLLNWDKFTEIIFILKQKYHTFIELGILC